MGHNELRELPKALAANTRLKIVDVGGCPVPTIFAIQVSAARLPPAPPAPTLPPSWVHHFHPTPSSPAPGHLRPPLLVCTQCLCLLRWLPRKSNAARRGCQGIDL